MLYTFDTLGIALIACRINAKILSILIKEEGFIPSAQDYNSLIEILAFNSEKESLDLVFRSFNMQFIFSSLNLES